MQQSYTVERGMRKNMTHERNVEDGVPTVWDFESLEKARAFFDDMDPRDEWDGLASSDKRPDRFVEVGLFAWDEDGDGEMLDAKCYPEEA